MRVGNKVGMGISTLCDENERSIADLKLVTISSYQSRLIFGLLETNAGPWIPKLYKSTARYVLYILYMYISIIFDYYRNCMQRNMEKYGKAIRAIMIIFY